MALDIHALCRCNKTLNLTIICGTEHQAINFCLSILFNDLMEKYCNVKNTMTEITTESTLSHKQIFSANFAVLQSTSQGLVF